MAPKRKATKEEILRKKREAERKRYEKIKNGPQKMEELREKERLKYLKKKEKGTRKLVESMTPREHRDVKKKWKEQCTKYRNKKKVLANITNSFIIENTPDSDVPMSCEMSTPRVAEIKNKNKEKMLRYKMKKKKDEEIKELQKRVLKYKKRLSRLKKSINPKPKDTPNTKLQKMADTAESRKDLVKIALLGYGICRELPRSYSRRSSSLSRNTTTDDYRTVYKLKNIKSKGLVNCTALVNAVLNDMEKSSTVNAVKKMHEKKRKKKGKDSLRKASAENSKDRDSLSGGESNASNNDDDEEDFFKPVTQSIEKPNSSTCLE
ncbi:hypothetical protein WA026_014211 [Henosepilachna vigintioctopunctata]|uniref:Uncharacterized protein n=1 Tax=Henosepilachna vigintioctopunctata TaxID=420089 RepID=A0AAW1TVK3_9CUCU